jgi:anhydro-N-acetylmuramic acid kinase
MAWFIGLMSGTSLDGVDGVLAEAPSGGGMWHTRAHTHLAFAAALRAELLALNCRGGSDELHRAALATNALTGRYAEVVALLLERAGIAPGQVSAIGAHGQTVRHRPGEFDGLGYTLQLMNGALLAERTGIDVVCDFRTRDVAAGGQGAPLVPAFHAARFARAGQETAVLNLGGVANLTLLRADGQVLGFDCGPGNILLDLWCQRHRGRAYDEDGAWAAAGRTDAGLLARLLAEPYFGQPPPKSTGRDLFSENWLAARLGSGQEPAGDVMATLTELTARAATEALQRHAPGTTQLLVCGGGAFNAYLMSRLDSLLGPRVTVRSTAVAGVPPDQVEALAFAWLAQAFVERKPGNLPAVTGAAGARLLGALYPAAAAG